MIKKASLMVMITVVILGAAFSPHKSHADASVSMDGFVIEADSVEGVMGIPSIITGETSTQKNKLMLRLTFSKATIHGLTITKVLNTPKGPVTIQFKSTGPVELTNMAVDVTKIEFGGIYLPNRIGELGMKNVRLVAHKQTADDADLPALVASLAEEGNNVDTTSDSDENLTKQAEVFKKILGDSKDGKLKLPVDWNKILQLNIDEEKDSKDQSSDKEENNPLDEINKVLDSGKSGKNEDSQNGSKKTNTRANSRNDNSQPANNEQTADKTDTKNNGHPSGENKNQNHQPGGNLQQTDENNTEVKNSTSDDSVGNNNTDTSNNNQNNNTVNDPAQTDPSTGDSDSGTNDQTKHGGLLDLLKFLLP